MKNLAEPPLVSVIMANYNGADHLAMALRSVLAQSVGHIEILLLDDASSDDSIKVARGVADTDPRVRIFETSRNAGPGAARNRGFEMATGRWIAIVDSDDIIHPCRLERMTTAGDALETDAVADDLTYFHDASIRPAGTLMGTNRPEKPAGLSATCFVSADPNAPQLGYLKPLIRRTALSGLRYREDIKIGEDHDLYMRFLLNGGRMHLLPQSYYLYRRHNSSLSYRMHPDDVAAIISAQDDLLRDYPDLSDGMLDHMALRRAALQRPLAFETLVQEIRGRHFGRAMGQLVHRPSLLPQLVKVGKSRLARALVRPRNASAVIARDPSEWTLQDWSVMLEKTM
ncbi:succinoglycan biosynthesis protein ExoO [Jannaschia helgolandensis]|uniref:Succinoglycan biosynthesis protein ExoO n=1 Tax=Jannaschia helgolandensis TaxID=188906 RepID=A0A1H7SAF3_9RHOB|nr:succinoglycan biosynthesis protein ExoO [Jannaschia helgolandensis]